MKRVSNVCTRSDDGIILSDLFEAVISGLEELFFHLWRKMAGLVVIGVGAATGLTLIMAIGLMIKIRRLTISIPILKRAAGNHAGKMPGLVFDFSKWTRVEKTQMLQTRYPSIH